MALDYLFVLLFCCLLSSHCYKPKKTLCDQSQCVYLFESDNNMLSWDRSYETCRGENLEMVRIESNQTQTLVENLLRDLAEDKRGQMWIGGRRSTDYSWRYMNGTEFPVYPNVDGGHCLYVRLCKNINPEYHVDNCDEITGASRLLCESMPEHGKCKPSATSFGDKCYTKTQYNGKDPNKIDWYKGEIFCNQSDIQGDIAYSYLHNVSLRNDIINFINPSKECLQLWFGVRRRIWFWKTAASNDYVDNRPIKYFYWSDTAPSAGDCIYIDKHYKWLTQSCSTNLGYTICMNATTTTTTRATSATQSGSDTTSSSTTTATTTTTNKASTLPTNSGAKSSVSPQGNKFNLIYIAPIIIGMIVIVLAVGTIVFFVLKKQRKEPEMSNDLLCEHVEFAADERRNDVHHKVAPSGDLYAISSKQASDSDINKNTDDTKLEELYAKPKKKRNQKSKALEGVEQTDTGTPSGGETNTKCKHTEYFEVPSGDTYATVECTTSDTGRQADRQTD